MTFDAIGIAGSGLTAHRTWLDALSDNIANINTAVAPGDEHAATGPHADGSARAEAPSPSNPSRSPA